jgi:hypothetical protein
MNEEIHNSREIQKSLHSQHLSQLLHSHLEEPTRLLSLQRSVFFLFRSRVARQMRLKKLSTERGIKQTIHLLLYCWRKLEKYVTVQRREKRNFDWIRKSRTALWFRNWKLARSKSQRTREHHLRRHERHLRKAINVWRRFLSHQAACRRVEGNHAVDMSRIKLRWIFRSWKTHIERELSAYNCTEGSEKILVAYGKKVLPPLTVALRCREVTEQRNSSLARLQFQRSHFNGWRRAIFMNRRVLADHEAVLTSIQTHRTLSRTLREWRSIFLSLVFKKNKTVDRSWHRWMRFASVRISSRRMKRRGAEVFHLRMLFRAVLHWANYKNRKSKLRNALRRCREYIKLKSTMRALVGWKMAYSLICEKRHKEGCAMNLYLTNLRKRSWSRWIEWHQVERAAKARKREWVQSERNLSALQVREEALSQRAPRAFIRNDQREVFVGRCRDSCSDSEDDSDLSLRETLSPHPAVTQKKSLHAFTR